MTTKKPMRTNEAGKNLIKKYEGLRLKAYLCPAKVWTIGYGHTADVQEDDVISKEYAEELLREDLRRFEYGVEKLLKGKELNENQFSALVSFAFNLGLGNLGSSTLLKLILNGDMTTASGEFKKWNKAGGVVLPGLVARRKEEEELFKS